MTDFFKCFLDEKCQRPENFFSHIKSELVNRVKWENYEEAKDAIDEYIRYYNNDRIQIKLKKAPMQYRSLFIE
ncbi:IS3 family transposase [Cloacibacillus evryensis]|uniref:IS3 family transposase n=1 Tax=Cloacibacillus evryensis TaxID=508460 RepID=UPI00349FE323